MKKLWTKVKEIQLWISEDKTMFFFKDEGVKYVIDIGHFKVKKFKFGTKRLK